MRPTIICDKKREREREERETTTRDSINKKIKK